MLRRPLVGIALLVATSTAAATDLDLSLGTDVAEIGLSETLKTDRAGNVRAGGAFLFNDGDDLVGSGFLHVLGHPQRNATPLSFGAGIKAFAADLDRADTTVAALGIGGSARLEAPTTRLPLAFTLSGHYAPDIVTTGSGDSVTELIGRVSMEIAPAASAYVGYRYLEFALDDHDDRDVDDDFHVGLRLSF